MGLNTHDNQIRTQSTAQEPEQEQARSRAGVQSEAAATYEATANDVDEAGIIARAIAIIDAHWHAGVALTGTKSATDYIKLKIGMYQWEVFGVLFLDNRHRVLAFEEMFRGTLDGSSVHPREVVRAALQHNAAAVILAHNHPSGVAEPSAADRNITRQLRDALALVGCHVIDHIVVGKGEPTSMASRGLI